MLKITDKYKCCGCEACVQACPRHCISFNEDNEGFCYPQVNVAACVECGLCEAVCPVLHQAAPRQPLRCFAAKNPDESIREESSSGGVFTLLAEQTIFAGGVVFGARFNSEWEVVHDYTDTIEGIGAFRTSKYVQSRIGDSFAKASMFLRQGRPVLFSGTSCQVAGLYRYLRKDYDNLLTVDVICHGVPSPGVWRRYLEAVKENARKGENSVSSSLTRRVPERDALSTTDGVSIESISFRDKRLGWKKFSFALSLAEASADGKSNTVSLSQIHRDNPFMQAFLSNLILRPSCYQCPAKGGRSRADITLADYWGIDLQMPDFDDDRGVSLFLINTQKGIDAYCGLAVNSLEVTLESALSGNKGFYSSAKLSGKRKKLFYKYSDSNVDIIRLMSVCSRGPFYLRKIWQIKRGLKKIIKAVLAIEY